MLGAKGSTKSFKTTTEKLGVNYRSYPSSCKRLKRKRRRKLKWGPASGL
jgi:hypothetical protein